MSDRMAIEPKSGEKPLTRKDARAERLAAALRANLKRRKQQTRARKADDRQAGAPGDER